MKKMYIIIILGLVIILGFGYWWHINHGASPANPKPIISPVKKAYSLDYATLDVSSGKPVFKYVKDVQGVFWTTVIVPLPDSSYLITKFTKGVVPGAHFTQDFTSTYLYANNKFSPSKINLSYNDDGTLDGHIMGWGSHREGIAIIESALLIHIDPVNIVSIDNTAKFKTIQQLPGFENATYIELKMFL